MDVAGEPASLGLLRADHLLGETFERALPIHVGKVHDYFHQHLTDEELEVLTRAMAKILRGLGADVPWLIEDLEAAPQ